MVVGHTFNPSTMQRQRMVDPGFNAILVYGNTLSPKKTKQKALEPQAGPTCQRGLPACTCPEKEKVLPP